MRRYCFIRWIKRAMRLPGDRGVCRTDPIALRWCVVESLCECRIGAEGHEWGPAEAIRRHEMAPAAPVVPAILSCSCAPRSPAQATHYQHSSALAAHSQRPHICDCTPPYCCLRFAGLASSSPAFLNRLHFQCSSNLPSSFTSNSSSLARSGTCACYTVWRPLARWQPQPPRKRAGSGQHNAALLFQAN